MIVELKGVEFQNKVATDALFNIDAVSAAIDNVKFTMALIWVVSSRKWLNLAYI